MTEELWRREPLCEEFKEFSPRINAAELEWLAAKIADEGGIRDMCEDSGYDVAKAECCGLVEMALLPGEPLRVMNLASLLPDRMKKSKRKKKQTP